MSYRKANTAHERAGILERLQQEIPDIEIEHLSQKEYMLEKQFWFDRGKWKLTSIWRHWQFFLAMEREMITLSQYVSFQERNFERFSIEIMKMILVAGAEIEGILKELCLEIDAYVTSPYHPNFDVEKRKDMKGYRECLKSSHKMLVSRTSPSFIHLRKIGIFLSDIELQPFAEWEHKYKISWWKSFQRLKHGSRARWENEDGKQVIKSVLHNATLKNLLNMVSAMLILDIDLASVYTYNHEGDKLVKFLHKEPELFDCQIFKVNPQDKKGRRSRW